MTAGQGEAWLDDAAGHLVRPYAITRGRTRPTRDGFALITLVATANGSRDSGQLEPEAAEILDMCRDRALAVAEISALLDLPVSVIKVLLGDLLDCSMIITRAPVPVDVPDVALLQAVIDGLHRL